MEEKLTKLKEELTSKLASATKEADILNIKSEYVCQCIFAYFSVKFKY